MDKYNIKIECGKRFLELIKASKYKYSEFGKTLGIENPSQTVNHWFKRGVPAVYASKAAELLGCTPSEISDVMPSSNESEESIFLRKKGCCAKGV